MIAPRRLARLVAGDFAERTRRYAFLLTLAFTVWAATIFVPPLDAGYTTVSIHGHRGFYNSAWLGAQLALLVNAFLGLTGFYLVKGAIDRDRRTGVGELLAATSLSRTGYTLSKMLSNGAVLASMGAVVVVCSGVLQRVRAEEPHIDLGALVLPHLLITLPFLALVAAIAVLFETLPLLRGGIGNIAWFFLWSFGGVMGSMAGRRHDAVSNDPMGIGAILPGMVVATRAAFPAESITGERIAMGIQIGGNQGRPLVPFEYGGIEWTPEMIGGRLLWLAAAVFIAAAAALPFDRFANAGVGWAGGVRAGRKGSADSDVAKEVGDHAAMPGARHVPFDPARLDQALPQRRFDLPTLVRAELRVALKGYPRFWYLVVLGLSVGAWAAPLGVVKAGLTPVFAIWPIFLWSALGGREVRHGTAEMFFSAPRPLSRLLPATWLAGVAMGALASGAYGLRLAFAGDGSGVVTWLVGTAFVPALALACGVLTGDRRLFEALYMFLWYVAALNHVPALDFTGATVAQTGLWTASGYGLATVALLAVAWGGRRQQLTR